jgi:hypothetical protein
VGARERKDDRVVGCVNACEARNVDACRSWKERMVLRVGVRLGRGAMEYRLSQILILQAPLLAQTVVGQQLPLRRPKMAPPPRAALPAAAAAAAAAARARAGP